MPPVQVLTTTSPDYEAILPKIHTLSRQVFEPEMPKGRPPNPIQLDLQNWRTRLADPDAAIFYTTSKTEEEVVSAFLLTHPRPLVVGSEVSVYYIYLAAVHPSARGQGLFPALLEATKQRAREKGYGVLSIGTVPSIFKRMYALLSREGSGWEVVEWKEGDDGRPKVVFKMDL